MKTPAIRILKPGDEAALEAFLLPQVETSMFLIGNQRLAGLADNGARYQGTHAASFLDDRITGVVAHYWNQNLVLQVAPADLLDARAEGVRTCILFTGEGNIPAQKVYEALGFRCIGDYRILLLRSGIETLPWSSILW
jgi:predicted GNAT family acetyltransferase